MKLSKTGTNHDEVGCILVFISVGMGLFCAYQMQERGENPLRAVLVTLVLLILTVLITSRIKD